MARYLTTEEVADITRAQPETVRAWRNTGKGPKAIRLPGSRRVLYPVEAVEAWLAEAETGATPAGGAR